MKKILTLIFFSLFLSLYVFCEANYYTCVYTDGSESKVYLRNDTKGIVLFDGDSNQKKIKSFKGLEELRDLDYIECYGLAFVENYDFLSDIKSCKYIYICDGKYFDFNILENVQNLEELEFNGYVNDEVFEKIVNDGIDVSKLKYLKKLTFWARGQNMNFDLKIKYAEEVSEEK